MLQIVRRMIILAKKRNIQIRIAKKSSKKWKRVRKFGFPEPKVCPMVRMNT